MVLASSVMKRFNAPWSTSLIVVSAIVTTVCLAVTALLWRSLTAAEFGSFSFWLTLLPLALVVGSALFTVRGYTLSGDVLFIHRLFWSTRLTLAGFRSAEFHPAAMRGSIRTFGNGGFFSFTGWYRNQLLGSYRAFATEPQLTTALRFTDRTVVLSPDRPEEFIRELSPSGRNI
jgi:Bacterial PH domain